jgi:hypothetical protein
MSRRCTVCDHSQRTEIDAALIGSGSLRDIARQWRVSKDAVARHKSDHLPVHLAKAKHAEETTQADSLLGQLLSLNRATLAILQEAREGKDNELALKAIARTEKQIELQARLLGELQDSQTVNVLVMPEWQGLRAVILAALQPHPQARLAVVEALGGFTNGRLGA